MPIPFPPLHFAALTLLLFTVTASLALGAEYSLPKRVLIIDSFGASPMTAGALAFRATLERELGQPVDVYQASLDAARFTEPNHETQLIDFLKLRFEGHRLDLVVPLLAPAAQFTMRHRGRLFPDTPVVLTGVDRRRIPPGSQMPLTTYVAGEVDLPGHIDNILQVLPNTHRIMMMQGSSPYDRFWASENRRELQRFADRVEFVWSEGLSLADMRKEAAKLTTGSVVFIGLLSLDGAGIPYGRDEVLAAMREVSNVPIFGYFESYTGKGVVGGRLYPDVTAGIEAAHIAVRVLQGEALDTIAPRVLKQSHPIYDWRELNRFSISERRLPPESEVRYRQETVWETYRWHIAAGVTLLILQAVLIVGLMLQRARQRRTQAELLNTRAEFAHMTRVFTLGELSGSLAHELNQPLTAILSNVQAAQRFMKSGSPADLQEVSEILTDIAQDDKRAGEIIHRMRALVRKQELDATPIDMTNAAQEVVQLLHSDAMLRHVNVSFESEPGLPSVLGDRVQLQQVVLNLLLNAFDAVKASPAWERLVALHVGSGGERVLKVTVSDNGHGLSEDSKNRLFEAFYTTKAAGLGMGLAISRSIIEAHGGRLWAEDNSGRGATFCFTVPVAMR